MSLTKCKECGIMVSSEAKTCPHCGAKTKKSHPVMIVLVFLAGVFAVFSVYRAVSSVSHYGKTVDELVGGKPESKEQLQLDVKNWLNGKQEIKELGLRCTSVGLVKESSNKYVGLAKFDNGEETDVEVTADGDTHLFSAKFPQNNREQKPTNKKLRVTKEMYDQIKDGMSYAEVVKILGQEGEQLSSSSIGGFTTEMYMWQNFDGSNINIMIQNGVVNMKSQYGLP